MMPFQLSPVATRNSVRKAMPKSLKWACSPSPSQGCASEHSENQNHQKMQFKKTYCVHQNLSVCQHSNASKLKFMSYKYKCYHIDFSRIHFQMKIPGITLKFKMTLESIPSLPKSSTPRAAKMKKRRKKRRPRLPTCGRACMTVSSRARIPFAIFSNFNTATDKQQHLL